MSHDHPDFRATIRLDGSLWLVSWQQYLQADFAWHTTVASQHRRGICLADFKILHDEDDPAPELIVTPLTGLEPEHREAIASWAGIVGYRRVWIGDEVIEPEPKVCRTAVTRCRSCRHELVGKGADFWDRVRHMGFFPPACLICGCDVPQWQEPRRREEATPSRPRMRASARGRQPRHHEIGL
jgi:hypothetical protein